MNASTVHVNCADVVNARGVCQAGVMKIDKQDARLHNKLAYWPCACRSRRMILTILARHADASKDCEKILTEILTDMHGACRPQTHLQAYQALQTVPQMFRFTSPADF
jgi:hypothetical protein